MTQLLIHAPDAEAFARAIRNLNNARIADPSIDVELLLNGPAVKAALDHGYTDEALRICTNSLRGQQIEPLPSWHCVDAAVLYAAQRQQQGWAYFRA